MTLQDIISDLIGVGNKIDVLWNIFIAAHFAILALYYVLSRGDYYLTLTEKIALVLAYSIFLYLNGAALISSYEFFNALNFEAKALLVTLSKDLVYLNKYVTRLDLSNRPIVVVVVHSFAFLLVTLRIFIKPILKKK